MGWILVLTFAFAIAQPANYPLADARGVVRFATLAECRARIAELQPRLTPIAKQVIDQSGGQIVQIQLHCKRPVEA